MRVRASHHARRAASLLCAAAVGALLFSVQVATMAFREIADDRMRAGRVAGHAFVGAYGIAAVAGVVTLVVVVATGSGLRERVLAAAMTLGAALELFWIAPAILAHGAGWPGTFASLHAVGGAVHLLLATVALILAWRLLGDVPAQRF